MLRIRRLLALTLASSLGGALHAQSAGPENVLLVIADDFGVDNVGCYKEGRDLPSTPTIDMLARNGVLFRNAWGCPSCSPTRATIYTGLLPFRTGVLSVVTGTRFGLPLEHMTLPEVLDQQPDLGYSHALLGKWHLGNLTNGAEMSANLAGFSHYAGAMSGLFGFNRESYYQWWKNTNGVNSLTMAYNTSVTVDDAIAWLSGVPEPWFLVVAFCAPHEPFHAPPPGFFQCSLPHLPPGVAPRPYYKAAVEAMDAELGRLLLAIKPHMDHTNVLFVGDNGTPAKVTVSPFDPSHAKGSIYEGGINVPLIVSGPRVVAPDREVEALVQTTDLFKTVTDLAGVDLAAALPPFSVHDSVSLVPYLLDPDQAPKRKTAFTQSMRLAGGMEIENYALRDERFKLIRSFIDRQLTEEQLFDLIEDPFERQDLLAKHTVDPEHAALAKKLGQQMDLVQTAWQPPDDP